MGFWNWLTGGGKAVESAAKAGESIVGGIVSGLDHMSFSDEEKAEHALQAAKIHLEMVRATVGESSIRSVTRRILAWAIVGVFLSLIVTSAAIYKLDLEYANHLFALAKELFGIVLAVVGFYFGVHLLRTKG
jgi:hypothetical protein